MVISQGGLEHGSVERGAWSVGASERRASHVSLRSDAPRSSRSTLSRQSTYKNSLELRSTWQKSIKAAVCASTCAPGEKSDLMLWPLGEESLKRSGSSKRQ